MSTTKGSQWRKWDLHFHTPSSYDYKKQISNEEIIDGVAAKGISVIAVTDHHVIDVARITELQNLGKQRGITVLPGIEFLSDAKGSEPIHFIAIFSETSDIGYIWGQIENNTSIKKIRGEQKKHNEVYCDLKDTITLIKELGGLVTIHAGSKSNTIDNITNALPHSMAQKQDIAEMIDIFEMGKESDCEDYRQKVIPFLKKLLSKHIPLILCSDNHNIHEYSIKQYLWIKSDPTLEGLKQILYEPEHRVKVQSDEPDFKENRLIIESVRFLSSKNRFTPETIQLNKNLNVIIGGKSSGKSILLSCIARTLLTDKSILVKENIEEKYNFKSNDDDFNFEITTGGGFKQLMHRGDSENSVIPEVKYIPQNYLIKLAEPEISKRGEPLNKIIRELINEDSDSRAVYDTFLSTVKANDKKRNAIIDNYFDIKEKIHSLQNILKSKSNKSILEKNIESNEQKVADLNKSTGMDEAAIASYNNLQNQFNEITTEITKLSADIKKINEFNQEASDVLQRLQNRRNLVSESLEHPDIKSIFDQDSIAVPKAIENLRRFESMFETEKTETGQVQFKNTSAVSNLVREKREKRTSLLSQLEPYIKNQDTKKQIQSLSESITEDRKSLQDIDHLNKEILINVKAMSNEKEKIFQLYLDNHAVYIDTISQLKSRTIDLEKDGLNITGLVKFNFNKFQKRILDLSDKRKASYSKFENLFSPQSSISDYDLKDITSEMQQLFSEIAETEDYGLTSKTDRRTAIKALLDDYFFDYWQIEYKNDKLGGMSAGKASFVILMLIVGLSKSKAPILIDQPEDNLDNRSITTDLVEYLRGKKLERQIILVTHNPNVVVNADAENIIVANQKGQNDIESSSPYQFDYVNGPLEHSFKRNEKEKDLLKSMGIREHIAEVVEGGKEAFKKREEKYGFR